MPVPVTLLLGSVSNVQSPNNSIFDQTHKLMRPFIVPAQMMAAAIALTEGPGTPRKPRILQGRNPGLATTQGFGKRDDFKRYPGRIDESKFVFAPILEPVLLVGDSIQAPGAQPLAGLGVGPNDGSGFSKGVD